MNEINKLYRDINLPVGDKFTQDRIYELPDEYRTKEWLNKYISAYLNNAYSLAEKKELMTLCLDVTNDLLSSGLSHTDEIVVKVLKALLDNHQNHKELIDYWSLDDEPLEDCFTLTPVIRKLKKRMRRNSSPHKKYGE